MATYARVSSKNQLQHRANQQREINDAASTAFPEADIHEFVDVGSGLNFKRHGLRALLELCMQRRVQAVVVTYRDRICRFGFDLIEWLLDKYDTKVMVLHSPPVNTTELEVVTVFSARAHGIQKYKRALEKELDGEGNLPKHNAKKRRTCELKATPPLSTQGTETGEGKAVRGEGSDIQSDKETVC